MEMFAEKMVWLTAAIRAGIFYNPKWVFLLSGKWLLFGKLVHL
jgi:hypothetical protein